MSVFSEVSNYWMEGAVRSLEGWLARPSQYAPGGVVGKGVVRSLPFHMSWA